MEEFQYQESASIKRILELTENLRTHIAKAIIGQHELVDLLLVALVSDGHVLLEGVPGIAKTLTAKVLAKSIDAQFKRIQFTPDLMPSDVIGTNVFNAKSGDFEFKRGPIFGNLVLIDEINRAPAKTQSSLFEVMEERAITVDGKTYPMDLPFLVIATQNPIEHEGTYQLPEAQLDRFLFKIIVGYPSIQDEFTILKNRDHEIESVLQSDEKILKQSDVLELRKLFKAIKIEDNLIQYIAKLVQDTRSHPALSLGASPRAGIAMMNASKAYAAIQGRDFVIPDDISYIITPILRHRISLTPEQEMDNVSPEMIIQDILRSNEIPR
jgi:MoxR-like ATPase